MLGKRVLPAALAALAALSLARAFAPQCVCVAGQARRLPGAQRVGVRRSHGQVRRCGALRLRAADLSLAVSETPPGEDPLANIPAVKVHTADGPIMDMPEEWNKSGVYACFNKQGDMQYVAMSRKVVVSIENHLQLLGDEDFHTCKVVTWDKPSKGDLEGKATEWIQYCIDLTGGAPPGNTREVDIWRAKASDVRRSKANIQFDPAITADKAKEEIVRIVKLHSVVLFIKGTRQAPQCGFTDATVALFDQLQVDYECIDCLDEERNPGLREAIKEFSQWPTIPQIYVGGEFVGGADVARELAESGELQEVIKMELAKKRRSMSI